MCNEAEFFKHSEMVVKAEVVEENTGKMWRMADEQFKHSTEISKLHGLRNIMRHNTADKVA